MSESTTPSDKKVPGAQPPWAPGNRAIEDDPPNCERCDGSAPTHYRVMVDAFLCRHCYVKVMGW